MSEPEENGWDHQTEEQIKQIFATRLAEIGILKKLDLDELSHHSMGLSYAEVHKICEDTWKDYLLYGENHVTEEKIIQYIMARKRTY